MITNEEAAQKVEDLIDQGCHKYTNWEVEFLSDQIERKEFTDEQLDKIEELWRKHCERNK